MSQAPPDLSKQFADFFPDPLVSRWAGRLMERLLDGHICVPCSDLGDENNKPGVACRVEGDAAKWISVGDEAPNKPFVHYNEKLYLQRYFGYETQIVDQLTARIQQSRLKWNERENQLRALVNDGYAAAYPGGQGKGEHTTQTDWQSAAVVRALCSDFGIITGGPGTGKTTTLVRLLEGVHRLNPQARVALAAPTGKASMRMLESIRQQAAHFPEDRRQWLSQLKPYTLHRLLGYVQHSIYFKHNRHQHLPFDWVVVDEASMVDVPMFAKLLEACSTDTRLLLLGDKDQLASVESGSLLGDLCASAGELNRFNASEIRLINQYVADSKQGAAPVANGKSDAEEVEGKGGEAGGQKADQDPPMGRCITELRYSHRFDAGSGIGLLAKAVLAGQAGEAVRLLGNPPDNHELMWYHSYDPEIRELVVDEVLNAYKSYVEEEDIALALERFKEYRVLTPVREGVQGLYALNARIEEGMRRKYPDRLGHREVFYRNRPLLVTRNDYALGLFNGDVGLVRPDPAHEGQLRVWFEGNEEGSGLRSFHPSAISACETAYAMTIHKSQGSEFNRVLVVLPEREESRILTRELIYTGLTRARKQVVVWGSEAVLGQGVGRSIQRISGLAERLK